MDTKRLSLQEVPAHSFFVRRSLSAIRFGASEEEQLEVLARLASVPFSRREMERRLDAASAAEALSWEMRSLRRDVLVALAARDMTGAADFHEVAAAMTALAEVTITRAVRFHARELARRFGVPFSSGGTPQDLLVFGMGKLGGAELNVSSDIDLIFVYDEGGETRPTNEFLRARRTLSNHEFFERLARRVIPALNDLEGPGFVFRVDMRLRPFGDSGPIVVSSSMLEDYLYTEGRDWERFAWLKGRVVNSPVFMTEEQFEAAKASAASLIKPFVYRKYVDFSAISALSRLHEMIRAESTRREAGRDRGINVKLGRGGIREIEFIAQTFQVIRGGREKELRGRQTLKTLSVLGSMGVLPEDVASRLAREYVFLRNLEHAIQYVDDKQTQLLPPDQEGQERIAAMVGMEREEMLGCLDSARSFIAGTFDEIFHAEERGAGDPGWPAGWQSGTPEAREAVAARLAEYGYRDAQVLSGRIARLLHSRVRSAGTGGAREQISRFVVTVAENACDWAKTRTGGVSGDEVFSRYLALLEVIAGRPTYVALLNQYPAAAARVGHVLAVSRWAAGYLAEHPILLDELIDGRDRPLDDYTPVDWSGWLEDLRHRIMEIPGDREQQLNLLRDAHHSAVFHLLLADLERRLSVERLADQLSALADAALELIIDIAWDSIPSKHRERPKFAVIGYGKLGGKELGYASDLDLVFLYDDDVPGAEAIYARLVRRMQSWLTVQTSSGKLFEIDMRLRPNGENGLVASSMELFRRYQRNEDGHGAWAWEHQALTRARFCAGDPDVGREFEKERRYILTLPRDPAKVAADVLEMRRKMLDGHPNDSGLFDVKHDRGGMVDIEFIVQMLVLSYSSKYPQLVNNFGNTLLLEMAGKLGLIPEELAFGAMLAYRRYRKIQRSIRLEQGESAPARVPGDIVGEEREAVVELWEKVFGKEGS